MKKESEDKIKELNLLELELIAEGDIDFVIELLSSYVKNTHLEIAEYSKALENDDLNAQIEIAHKLRTSFNILEFKTLYSLSVKIEDKEASIQERKEFIPLLEKSIESIEQKLQGLTN